MAEHGLVFILSGPTGCGKTTLSNRILEDYSPMLQRVITVTTRKPRQGEVSGQDYHFMSEEDFLKNVDAGAFFEHAEVYGKHYGVLKQSILDQVQAGRHVLVSIDVQGADTFRKNAVEVDWLQNRLVTIFVQPPTLNELRIRLIERNQDSREVIEDRLVIAKEEMKEYVNYDYCIPSSCKRTDYEAFQAIYLSERLKVRL